MIPLCLRPPFLTAQWRHLAILNYEVDPAPLSPRIPRGTELDLFAGRALVSTVGFLFLDTRLLGWPVPFHRNFEEVNLRFYVRRRAADGWRRGVVFVKELVPKRALAWVARAVYNENYVALPMRHRVESPPGGAGGNVSAEYAWKFQGKWNRLSLRTQETAQSLVPGSEEEFIVEHYWGYTGLRDGGTLEYRVEHPPWMVRRASEALLECDSAGLYGAAFAEGLSRAPRSAFLAEGSPVAVFRGERAA